MRLLLKAPRPYNVHQILGTVCKDTSQNIDPEKWLWSRSEGKCEIVNDLSDDNSDIRASQVVFTFQVRQYEFVIVKVF